MKRNIIYTILFCTVLYAIISLSGKINDYVIKQVVISVVKPECLNGEL